jgi:DNA-binding MarR family transcriptional regulator
MDMTSPTQVFDRLLEIALLIEADVTASFAGTALSTSRAHLLWELHRLGPSTQQSLATALGVTPRNVTGLVDGLEMARYVERKPHPHDRRAVLVTLTGLGADTVTGMARDREHLAARLVSGFSQQRLRALSKDLDAISTRLQAMLRSDESQPELMA